MTDTNISTFNFQETKDVRVIVIDHNPWFIANDVCEVLGFSHPASNLRRLDDDEKGVHTMHTPGGPQEMTIINESGLYSLILTSRKPEAKKFKKWVTSEVLPSIRKTGQYTHPQALAQTAPELFSANDMASLSRLIYLMTQGHTYEKAFVQAVYHRLRAVTGCPSPGRFHVGHIPLIASETRMIWPLLRALRDLQRKAEEMMVKRVLRNGENADKVLEEIAALLAKAEDERLGEANRLMGQWCEQEISQLIERKSPVNIVGVPNQEQMAFN